MKNFPDIAKGFLCISTCAVLFMGCVSNSIPISTSTKYAIDVLYDNQTPEMPYEELTWLELSNSEVLRPDQTKDDKAMLKRGNDAKAKQLLTARLVAEAQKIGADALINVSYQYYTTVKEEGYILKGLAVKYKVERY